MSETDITPPPPNEFIADASGVSRWRAEVDGITVRPVFKGVLVSAIQGETTVNHTISYEQARHLASLLLSAAPAPEQAA